MKIKRPEIFNARLKREAYDISDPRIADFLDLVSRDYPVRHACSMSGISHDTMRAWLKPSHPRYKPSLFKLFRASKEEGDRSYGRTTLRTHLWMRLSSRHPLALVPFLFPGS